MLVGGVAVVEVAAGVGSVVDGVLVRRERLNTSWKSGSMGERERDRECDLERAVNFFRLCFGIVPVGLGELMLGFVSYVFNE